jgi:hypothetical protein
MDEDRTHTVLQMVPYALSPGKGQYLGIIVGLLLCNSDTEFLNHVKGN